MRVTIIIPFFGLKKFVKTCKWRVRALVIRALVIGSIYTHVHVHTKF